MSRYSDIRRGGELNTALQNYTQYLQNAGNRPRQVNSRGARPPRSPLWLEPFGLDLNAGEVVQVSADDVSIGTLIPQINGVAGANVLTALGGNEVVALQRFKPARVTRQFGARNTTVGTSAITGRQYLRYNNLTRHSAPFGRQANTDSQFTVFNAIKAALLQLGTDINRVSLSEEDITY